MYQITQEARDEVAAIIAAAGKLPLNDAAYDLWKQMSQLDRCEGRPTPEEVQINRTLSPEQWHAKYRYEREHAHEQGPMFGYLKRAKPHASDADIRQAIIEAVKFYDACEKHFKWEGDFWDCVVRAVGKAQCEYPHYLDTTYRDARNHLAYLMK